MGILKSPSFTSKIQFDHTLFCTAQNKAGGDIVVCDLVWDLVCGLVWDLLVWDLVWDLVVCDFVLCDDVMETLHWLLTWCLSVCCACDFSTSCWRPCTPRSRCWRRRSGTGTPTAPATCTSTRRNSRGSTPPPCRGSSLTWPPAMPSELDQHKKIFKKWWVYWDGGYSRGTNLYSCAQWNLSFETTFEKRKSKSVVLRSSFYGSSRLVSSYLGDNLCMWLFSNTLPLG